MVNKKVLDDLKEKIFYEDYLSNQEKYENIIKEKFNDMKLIAVRAKKIDDDIDTFGLNDLLNETLNVCKNNIKGNLYKNVRRTSFSKIIDIFLGDNIIKM